MALPEPHFVDRDPVAILNECVAKYELDAGRALTPAQVESLLIRLIAYRETLIRIAIQEAAKQNLLPWARFPMIDCLAQIVGTSRLPALPARVPIGFTVVAGAERTVPAGTRVRAKDRKAIFATDADITIAAAATFASGWATCEVPGTVGNGYVAGQVSELVGTLAFAATVANTATSGGGTASEDTERLRGRIPTAADEDAVAGPRELYIALAKGAHQDVLDATCTKPADGVVRLVILVKPGGDASAVLLAVEEAADEDFARPFTDTVQVEEATVVEYEIEAELEMYAGTTPADRDASLALAQAAAVAFAAERAAGLGRRIVETALQVALKVGSVEVVSVLSSPAAVAVDEVATCTSISVELAP